MSSRGSTISGAFVDNRGVVLPEDVIKELDPLWPLFPRPPSYGSKRYSSRIESLDLHYNYDIERVLDEAFRVRLVNYIMRIWGPSESTQARSLGFPIQATSFALGWRRRKYEGLIVC